MANNISLKKGIMLTASFLFLVVLITVITSEKTYAAGAKMVNVSPGTVYNEYDFTGDNIPDSFVVYKSLDYDNCAVKIRVFINGKICLDKEYWGFDSTMKIIRFRNGSVFLYQNVDVEDNNGKPNAIYKYDRGSLKIVCDLNKIITKRTGSRFSELRSVKGNTLNIRHTVMSFTTGATFLDLKAVSKNGKITVKNKPSKIWVSKRTKNGEIKYRPKNKYTISRNTKIYARYNSKRAKYTFARGTKVKLVRAVIIKNQLFVKIRNTRNGKTGWLKNYKHVKMYTPVFKEAVYAG